MCLAGGLALLRLPVCCLAQIAAWSVGSMRRDVPLEPLLPNVLHLRWTQARRSQQLAANFNCSLLGGQPYELLTKLKQGCLICNFVVRGSRQDFPTQCDTSSARRREQGTETSASICSNSSGWGVSGSRRPASASQPPAHPPEMQSETRSSVGHLPRCQLHREPNAAERWSCPSLPRGCARAERGRPLARGW